MKDNFNECTFFLEEIKVYGGLTNRQQTYLARERVIVFD
jgi:hypothetical protein